MSRKSMFNLEKRLSVIKESQSPDACVKHGVGSARKSNFGHRRQVSSPMINMFTPDGIGKELTPPM
jgi:hypothetical protein